MFIVTEYAALRGRLPTFIENFLADRTMQVRVGSSLSDYYDQEQGVPQGGVLSTTCFVLHLYLTLMTHKG